MSGWNASGRFRVLILLQLLLLFVADQTQLPDLIDPIVLWSGDDGFNGTFRITRRHEYSPQTRGLVAIIASGHAPNYRGGDRNGYALGADKAPDDQFYARQLYAHVRMMV